jgi:hypothetical protein
VKFIVALKRELNIHSIYSVDEYQSLTNESHNPWKAADFHIEISVMM